MFVVSVTYKTIKVTDDVHRQLVQLVRNLNAKGWAHLGVARQDSPTISGVIEEGILTLCNKNKSK